MKPKSYQGFCKRIQVSDQPFLFQLSNIKAFNNFNSIKARIKNDLNQIIQSNENLYHLVSFVSLVSLISLVGFILKFLALV